MEEGKMKKKILLSLIVIFLILTLAGCGNKEKIEEVLDNYWLAISNRQYELARTYCIPGGSNYRYSEHLQKEQDSTIRITFIPCITKWNWGGGVGSTDAFLSTEMVITSTGIFGMSATETVLSVEFLTKVNGTWKLK